jgi:hypothetical protein
MKLARRTSCAGYLQGMEIGQSQVESAMKALADPATYFTTNHHRQ